MKKPTPALDITMKITYVSKVNSILTLSLVVHVHVFFLDLLTNLVSLISMQLKNKNHDKLQHTIKCGK